MIKFIGDWEETLVWCPSQLYRLVEDGDIRFVIYCRWRHGDPWTMEFIFFDQNSKTKQYNNITKQYELTGDSSLSTGTRQAFEKDSMDTPDLLEPLNLFYKDDDYKALEAKSEELAANWRELLTKHFPEGAWAGFVKKMEASNA